MKCNRIIGLLLASALFSSAGSSAQESEASGNPVWLLMKAHDKDNDNKVSSSEYSRGADKFKWLDKNADGFLTEEDFPYAAGN